MDAGVECPIPGKDQAQPQPPLRGTGPRTLEEAALHHDQAVAKYLAKYASAAAM